MAIVSSPRIVLVGTQHPGNIGGAARAMKTMGLDDLALVAPLRWPDAAGFERAAGADDLLHNAKVHSTLAAAVRDCTFVAGCTARTRRVAMDTRSPENATQLLRQLCEEGERVAIVFGRERSGLTNEELQLCHVAIHIPTSAVFSSLNLAAAVQVIAYEFFKAQCLAPGTVSLAKPRVDGFANHEQLEHLYRHWQLVLDRVDFHKGRPPSAVLHQLRRLFAKHRLTERELRLLHGILSDIERHLPSVQIGREMAPDGKDIGTP